MRDKKRFYIVPSLAQLLLRGVPYSAVSSGVRPLLRRGSHAVQNLLDIGVPFFEIVYRLAGKPAAGGDSHVGCAEQVDYYLASHVPPSVRKRCRLRTV
ncbi:hypothetical protein [Frankia sp. CiP1_Cm_nod1]|uniref:hypothetical protein n=1 Tax=Frankia sp. CiP1_Cm_nod1 TaxID=2897160 RepID=UPI0020253C80